MVRSNSVSGVGLVAFCESLETRSLFSVATIDTAFKGGVVQTHFGYNSEVALTATTLPNGKLAVGGVGDTKAGDTIDLIAVYNKDGQLSNAFNDDGKAQLDAYESKQVGVVRKIVGLADGGMFVVGDKGFIKLLANGRADTSYGYYKTGIVTYAIAAATIQITDADLTPDGNIRILLTQSDYNGYQAFTFGSDGRVSNTAYQSATNPTDLAATFLPDRTAVVTSTADGIYTVTRLDASFNLSSAFGKLGAFDLTPAYHKFVNDYQFGTIRSDAQGYPQLTVRRQQLNADGSILIEAVISATSPKVSDAGDQTVVFINVNAAGTGALFTPIPKTGSGIVFDGAYYSDFGRNNGVYYTNSTDPTEVSVTTYNGPVYLYGATADAAGSQYVFGYVDQRNAQGGFVVAKLKPIANPNAATPIPTPTAASITGVLFNDDNGDGVKQSSETVNAARVVFLDTNGDGKLNTGERSVTTDAQGRYTFDNVAAGTYRVRRVLPNGYQVTTTASQFFGTTTVTAGVATTVDVGSTARAIVSGQINGVDSSGKVISIFTNTKVFVDLNKDGKFQDNEPYSITGTVPGKYGNYYQLPALVPGSYRLVFPSYPDATPVSGSLIYDLTVGMGENRQVNFNYRVTGR